MGLEENVEITNMRDIILVCEGFDKRSNSAPSAFIF